METDGMCYEIPSTVKPRLHGVVPSYGTLIPSLRDTSWEALWTQKGLLSMSAGQIASKWSIWKHPFWTLSSGGPETG